LAEAEAKGNLYASVFFRTTYANSAWLLHDDVGTAREQLSIAATEWRAQGTQLPHCWLLVGHANFAFYSGDHEQLWSRIEREWPRFVSAQFLRVGMLRVQLWQLRAWAALAQAQAHFRAGRARQAQRFNQEGRRCARLLDKQPLEFAKPLAALALAAADRQSGDFTQARIRLARCVEVFTSLDMKLYAATASTRLGELLGGDEGAQLVTTGRSAFAAEGVIGVARMLNMLSPDCTD
jgi:hypothetical protein